MDACVKEMLQYIHAAEQQHNSLTEQFKDWEARTRRTGSTRRKAAQVVLTHQAKAQKDLDAAQTEFRQQLEEADQTIRNLRARNDTLEFEVSNVKDRLCDLERQKTLAMNGTLKLEQQSEEYLAKCKALTVANEELARRPTAHTEPAEEAARL